jgi:hypothetical protein
MRALPADSFEYFGDTAVGKTAFPGAFGAAGAVAGVADGVAAAGAVAGVADGVAAAGAAAASAPHWVLRKSFQLCPLKVPAVFAAWYLALHSFTVSAPADDVKTRDNPAARAATEMVAERMGMWSSDLSVWVTFYRFES